MGKIQYYLVVLAVSIGFMCAGGFMFAQSYRAARNDLKAVGQIVDVATSRSSKGGTMYAPVIRFQTPDGAQHEFTSKMSSSMRPVIGASTAILYSPSIPEDAVVESVFDMYVFPGIFFFTGLAVLFLTTVLPSILKGKRKKKGQRLRSIGKPIQAQITDIGKSGMEVGGVVYYAISAQWVDASTNAVHLFKSDQMPYDPTSALQGKKEITVFVNPEDPKDYWVDTSGLPSTVIE
jgi:hypothetical protein